VIGVRKVADTSQFRAEHAPAFGGFGTTSPSASTKTLRLDVLPSSGLWKISVSAASRLGSPDRRLSCREFLCRRLLLGREKIFDLGPTIFLYDR
jgi:hypothetical protein